MYAIAPQQIRAVTHLGVSSPDADRAAEIVRRVG